MDNNQGSRWTTKVHDGTTDWSKHFDHQERTFDHLPVRLIDHEELMMNVKTIGLAILVTGALAACGNDGQSVGNGPGDADGVGGRADPAAATSDASSNASTTDPVGAQTTPDGSTEDTTQTPLQTNEPPSQTP